MDLNSKLGLGGEGRDVTHPKYTMGSGATSKELGVNADCSSEKVESAKLGLKAGGHATSLSGAKLDKHNEWHKKHGSHNSKKNIPESKTKMAMGGVGKERLDQVMKGKISKEKLG